MVTNSTIICFDQRYLYQPRRDGVVVSVRFAVGRPWVCFPSRVIPRDFIKMVFIASLLGAQQNRDSVESKLASLLVVTLGKTLNGMPPSLCDRQMVGPNSLPVVVVPVQLKTRKPSISANALYIHLSAQSSQQIAQTTKKKTYISSILRFLILAVY